MKDSSVYEYEINFENKNLTPVKELELVGFDKKVLEFGCSVGHVSKIMKERGCTVTGIEIDGHAAKKAEGYCERVIVGDIETIDFNKELSDEKFDIALFGDILEHLKEPKTILLKVKDFLKENGYIVISIPNIAHWSTRLDLLCGKFDYQELGILDDTHLRFFTKSSIINLLESCGYYVSSIDGVRQDVDWVKVSTIMRLKGLNDADIKNILTILNDSEAGVFQYVIKAIPSMESAYLKKISAEKSCLEEQILNLEGQITDFSGQLKEKEQQINELNGAVQGKDAQIQILEGQITDFSGQLKEKEQQINELNGAVQGKDAQIQILEGQITDFSGQLKEKEQQINELNGAVQGKDAQIQILEGQITDFSGQLKEKEQQINELNGAVHGKDVQIQILEGQITDFSGQLKEKEQQINELNGAVHGKDVQIQILEGQITDFFGQLKEKEQQINELNGAVHGKDVQIQILEGQITDFFGQLAGKDKQIDVLNVAVQGKEEQIRTLEGQITNISSQLREMEGRIREIEMENLRINSELNSMKSSVTWRIVMKWHSLVETLMPQRTRRRSYYDLGIIGLRTITNEGWRSFWWKYKQHRCSRKHKELITKSTEGKILENAQDRTEMLDPMDDYTKKTKIWLDNRFKLCDNEGIYIAHQPIYGFRKGHSEPGLADKYCRTYQIMKALSYLEFNSLLDVGGAEGYKAHVVKEIFDTEVRNSDLSEEACKRCEEIFHIKSDPIDLHNLPYDDDAFEVILCSETLEHVTDWRKAINELFRVASKAIVITVPHEDEAVIRENIKNGIPHGHIHNFTPNSFNFLEFKGYTVISKKIISRYFRLIIEPELKYPQNSGCIGLIKKIFGKKIASVIIKSDNLFVKFGKRFDGILFVILKDKKALLEHKKKKISAHQIISIEVPYYYLK